jgi:predicted RNase H-like HicB family nuclease
MHKGEDGHDVGSVSALAGCHAQGMSIDQLLERMQEAIIL